MRKHLPNSDLKYSSTVIAIFVLTLTWSCNDFLSIDPPKTEIVNETVFSNDASATSAIRGVYSLMMTNQSFTNGQIERYTGLSSDELINHSNNAEQQQFYIPSVLAVNSVILNTFWREAYRYINNVNTILNGLQNSPRLSDATRIQLEGEARFIRAFCHFYLVNLFGDVPYVTTTDYKQTSTMERTPVHVVYAMINEDLTVARQLLKDDFSFSNGNRTQPNRVAATALLARVKLYMGEWENVETLSSEVISNSQYQLEQNLNQVFLANSKEAIWQLQPVTPEKSTTQARIFVLTSSPLLSGSPSGVSLSDGIVNSFETNDKRLSAWVGSYTSGASTWKYASKYKVVSASTLTEHVAVLRLAEQYLIRAEARAQQDKLALAIEDLDAIRLRAGISLVKDENPVIDKPNLLLAIENERKVELFAEWGHRWLDLKRTGRADHVLSPLKLDWQSTDALYPIPDSERIINPKLTQNP